MITPATVYGKKYAAPQIAQAQAFGQKQWEKSIQPQISKLNNAAQEQYRQNLAPHVSKALETVGPYYAIASQSALDTYYVSILPTYNAIKPHVQHAYHLSNEFAVNTGIPYAKWAWATGVIFLDRTVWPKIRILYGENVEPQLIRIGERLGRYRDGKRLQSAIEEMDS